MRSISTRRIAFTAGSNAPIGERHPVLDEREAEDSQLLARCRGGDAIALRALYDREVPAVRRLARFLGVVSEEEVDDVTQDVFIIAFKNLERARPGSLSAWLFRITSNRVTDRHRRRRIREGFIRRFGWPEPAQELAVGPVEELERKDAQNLVSRVLARMRPKQREVLALFELEELPGEQVAERLQVPLATVWTRLFHARREFARLARRLDRSSDRKGDAR